ncbi:serine/threonine-protein kinase [Dictyobacter kobayashii]|uniref:non-specific serine/threonine protein kinase n=1 Tax=Dictyobacter kobayashii TaxID=2014872 RepID=A0A402ABQ9_9CHLR|nr:serine/threonine-protein kinase [Dictyobacter kobayashii]GCE16521.1 hypothetical protein KDK_03210 [Dictyobacter kobayashii]
MVNDKLLGSQLGSYVLVEILGHGAFGSVYLGKHFLLEHKPPVAVKVLNTTLNTQEEIDRFFQEAVILDKLTHPNILPVVDANLYEGYPFFVAEYAPGGSLRDRLDALNGSPMPLTDAMHILNQVGMALQHAHDLDIVHRDLKPANILFNTDGDAVLADFGIAIHVQRTRRVDEIGTPPYMSPEQFKGKISKKSDQYALGCVAYELLTGQQLFIADDPYTIGYKHIYEQPVLPSTLNPSIPPAIEEIILKALSKERDDRFENVADFVIALREALGLPMTESTPLPPLQSSLPLPSSMGNEYPSTNPSRPVQPEPPASRLGQPLDPHRTQAEDGVIRGPRPLRSPAQTPIANRAQLRPQTQNGGQNSARTVLAWSVTTGLDHTYYSEPAVLNSVVYAGTYTTNVDNPHKEANQLRALDALTGQQLWAVTTNYGIYDAPVVANGVVYVCTGNINLPGEIYAVDAASGEVRWSFPTDEFVKVRPTVTNDIVYAYPDHAVYALDTQSGREIWAVTVKAGLAHRPALASGHMYLITERGICYELDAFTGQKIETYADLGEILAAETTVTGINCLCFAEGELYALDMQKQQRIWTTRLDVQISGDLILKNGVAYIGSHGGFVGDSANTKLHAIDTASGKILWIAHLRHEIESAPVIADNNIVYVSTFGRELYAIDAQNGHILFTSKVGKGRINRPAAEQGMIFVSTGEMHALQIR